MRSLQVKSIRDEFNDQMALADALLIAGNVAVVPGSPGIGRETRGLTMVVLFAAYEKLLRALAREILETASTYRGHKRNLAPGLRALSLAGVIESVQASSKQNLWTKSALDLEAELSRPAADLNPGAFPDTGTFMDDKQLSVYCRTFGITNWGPALGAAKPLLAEIRRARNNVAHGDLTAREVGRSVSIGDMQSKVQDWRVGWNRFLDAVEVQAMQADFFKLR